MFVATVTIYSRLGFASEIESIESVDSTSESGMECIYDANDWRLPVKPGVQEFRGWFRSRRAARQAVATLTEGLWRLSPQWLAGWRAAQIAEEADLRPAIDSAIDSLETEIASLRAQLATAVPAPILPQEDLPPAG